MQSNTSSSGLWREFVWKNLIRFFITPKIKQSQGGQPESGQCWRECGNCQADHFHIFWDCSIIQPYWSEITLMINQIIGLNIKQDFCILYLGNLSATVNVLARYLLKIMMAASKKTITRRWLTKEPPTKKDWIGIVSEIQNMWRAMEKYICPVVERVWMEKHIPIFQNTCTEQLYKQKHFMLEVLWRTKSKSLSYILAVPFDFELLDSNQKCFGKSI